MIPTTANPLTDTLLAPERPSLAAPPTTLPFLIRQVVRGCWRRESWTRAALIRLALVFALATLFSWLGIVLSRQSEGRATIWLSNGLIFGLLITHRVAGPIYVMTRIVSLLAQGKYPPVRRMVRRSV